MSTDRSTFGIAEMPMISPQVANLIPYGLARRLCSIPVSATSTEITVMSARSDDQETLEEIRLLTGRNVRAIEVSLEDVDHLLAWLSGRAEKDDLWLQRGHIQALGRLADASLNRGASDAMRSLIDRALEFAPYSADLWLIKARVAIHRSEVTAALATASQISPRDRRISRWLQTIQGAAEEREPPGEQLPWAATSEQQPPAPLSFPTVRSEPQPSSPGRVLETVNAAEEAFRAARDIAGSASPEEVLEKTVESLQRLAGADSVSVYFQQKRSWKGHSSDPLLRSHLSQALPKQNRVAAQAVKQGLPIVVADSALRADEVGPLIARSGIRSFALIPVSGRATVSGLAYLNFNEPGQAGSIFDPNVSRAVEVVLNAAGARAAALGSGESSSAAIDSITNAYSLSMLERMLGAELERARRYQLSVSLLSIDMESVADDESHLSDGPQLHNNEAVLTGIAAAITTASRASDVLAHADTARFVLMLPQTTHKGAETVAGRVEAAVRATLSERGFTHAAMTVKVATFPEQASDLSTLMAAVSGAAAAGSRAESSPLGALGS